MNNKKVSNRLIVLVSFTSFLGRAESAWMECMQVFTSLWYLQLNVSGGYESVNSILVDENSKYLE